ncbi:MAG: hypothetical protein JWO99_367 [Candidatus Saccharibacteria bacterium]|nr:hypothetical protein [Candidatus Saccharibacteria bacterium]
MGSYMTYPKVDGDLVHAPQSDGFSDSPLLEQEPAYERVHGRFERVELFAIEYVKMSQVRGEKNTVSEELKDSIERTDLLNSIDVAHLDEVTLAEYISFVNEVWGSDTSIEEFADKRRPDGTYFLVIAGHSRHQAITELEEEGRIPIYPLEAKVHNVTTPEQIIQIQLDENIHSQPPRERRAVAIVETYEWGVRQGKWKTQKEFLAHNRNVGKSVLSEALSFSHIPPHIRNFILAGKAAYNTGIELGKTGADIKEHILFRMKKKENKLTVKQREKVAQLLDERLTIEMNFILNHKLNSTAAEKRLRAMRARLQRDMIVDEDEKQKRENTALFDLDLKTSDEILDEELAMARKEITEYLRIYSKTPSTSAAELIQLHREIIDPDLYEAVTHDFQVSVDKAARMVGVATLDAHGPLF